jgi:hypothetical protein
VPPNGPVSWKRTYKKEKHSKREGLRQLYGAQEKTFEPNRKYSRKISAVSYVKSLIFKKKKIGQEGRTGPARGEGWSRWEWGEGGERA